VCREHDFFPKHQRSRSLLGLLAERLVFFWTGDATELDTFSALLVEDFDNVAVEDGTTGPVKSAARTSEDGTRRSPMNRKW
jgi:hypothetical protein